MEKVERVEMPIDAESSMTQDALVRSRQLGGLGPISTVARLGMVAADLSTVAGRELAGPLWD